MAELPERLAGLSAAKLELLARRLRQRAEAPAPPIPRRTPPGSPAPLSYAQQRLWFVEQLAPGSVAYNIPLGLRLRGRLDVALLEKCLGEIERRHEVMRTSFADEGGRPVQVVAPPRGVSLPVVELEDLPEEARARAAERLLRAEAETPFDLSRGPLWRAKLLRLGEAEHLALFTMHHIISDGWSMGVLVREVGALYEAFSEGRPSPLAELPVQYADFAAWQREHLKGEALEAQLGYWRRQLAGAPPLLDLPTDRPRSARRTSAGAAHPFVVGREVGDALAALARREGATLFMVLLAGYAALLSRYSGQDDVLVGTAVAGRQRVELERLIGFFVNTLVVRADLGGRPSFRELIRRVREMTLGAHAHQDVPFEKLVEELQPERSLSHAPLIQASFILQNVRREYLRLGGLSLEAVPAETGAAKFDLTLVAEETPDGIAAAFVYSTDLFDAPTVAAMAERFQSLLRGAASDPDGEVGALAAAPDDESQSLIGDFNAGLE